MPQPECPPAEPPVRIPLAVDASVVMPCLNEALTVGRCVDKALGALARLGVAGEVVVADNMSTDGSPEIARAHGARVVRVARLGYGSALLGGIAAAQGRFVIIGDADASYDFSALDPFIERLKAGDDLVIGNRFRGGIRPGAMPWLHRYVGNPVLSGILNLFFRTPVGDAHCGLRAFRKDSYARLGLNTTGMEFASEMVVKAALLGLRMSEVPTVLYPDGRDRPPHLRSFRDGWRHLRFLLLMSPRWLFLIPAVCLFLLAVGGVLCSALAGPTLGLHALLLAGPCLVGGHQAFWLWAFAQDKNRPAGAAGHARCCLNRYSLEGALVLGTAAFLAGLVTTAWSLAVGSGAGPASPDVASLRCAVCGAGLMLLGLQTVFNAFFLGVLRLGAAAGGGVLPLQPAQSVRAEGYATAR